MPQLNVDQADTRRVRAYYGGTATLPSAGAFFCFTDAPTNSAQLGFEVVKPATAFLANFAGILAPSHYGKTGPCYVELIVAGTNVAIYAGSNCVKSTTFVGPVDGQWYGQAKTALSTLLEIQQAVCLAMETDATLGATPANVQARIVRPVC